MLSLLIIAGCSSRDQGDRSAAAAEAANPFAGADSIAITEAAKTAQASFRLVFAGNINGETEPCGCAVNPKGGIDRRLNFVRTIDTEIPGAAGPKLFVDAGNALFTNETLQASHDKQHRAAARLVLKAHALMGIKHQNVGHLDLSAGAGFLKEEAAKQGIALISANLADSKGELLFPATAEIALPKGPTVVVVGVTRGFDNPNPDFRILDPEAAIRKAIAGVPSDRAVVVLSDMGLSLDREIFAKIERPVVVVGGRDLNQLEYPEYLGSSILVQTQLQGQQWGVLDVAMRKDAKRWYEIGAGKKFFTVWRDREEQIKEIRRDKASVSDAGEEIDRMELAREELLAYAPKDLALKHVADYRLIDMTAEFAKKNELSPLMKKGQAKAH